MSRIIPEKIIDDTMCTKLDKGYRVMRGLANRAGASRVSSAKLNLAGHAALVVLLAPRSSLSFWQG